MRSCPFWASSASSHTFAGTWGCVAAAAARQLQLLPLRQCATSHSFCVHRTAAQITLDEWESIFDFYGRTKPLEALIKKRRNEEALKVISRLQEERSRGLAVAAAEAAKRPGGRRGRAQARWDKVRRAPKGAAAPDAGSGDDGAAGDDDA